jgi:N6-adenosine-specific RNA methylase IME4/ParB-like chromosome segregation protein Spo0J
MLDQSKLQYHPLADLFPLMEGEELDDLVRDIRTNGLHQPVVLFDGMILEGRNRYRACQLAGVDSRYELYGGTDPLSYVISLNLTRRHLDAGQRAMVAARLVNVRQGERTDLQLSANLRKVDQATAARLLQVSERSVQHAKVVQEQAPTEVVVAVEQGKIAVSTAAEIASLSPALQREIAEGIASNPPGRRAIKQIAKQIRAEGRAAKHAERQKTLEAISANDPHLPTGRLFSVVLIDVPRRTTFYSDVTGSEKAPENHYPTMSFEQLINFPIDKFAAQDSILLYWSTAASLIDDLEIIAEWGFISFRPRDGLGKLSRPNGVALPPLPGGQYGSHQIWSKVRKGAQTGTGHWFRDQHEILIAARRGNIPAPLPGTQDKSVFDAPTGLHSQKPGEHVRRWIDRCWPDLTKIEMFARGKPPTGWVFWGNQAQVDSLQLAEGIRQGHCGFEEVQTTDVPHRGGPGALEIATQSTTAPEGIPRPNGEQVARPQEEPPPRSNREAPPLLLSDCH